MRRMPRPAAAPGRAPTRRALSACQRVCRQKTQAVEAEMMVTQTAVAGTRIAGSMEPATMGRATMAAPMPLMPLTKPAKNQAKAKSQREGSSSMAYWSFL